MKQKLLFNLFKSSLLVLLFVTSCTEDTDRPEWPLYADVFYSVDDKQVAFTALTHSATSWSWDFGDGNTSSEQNPVHVYETGGYYTAQLTATDGSGNTETSEVELAIALTPYVLLTGGPTATEGKTWKMSAAHSSNDLFANADANLSIYDEDIPSLPSGAFSLFLNMGEVYDDEFTFYHDGSYSHDTKEDGAAFAGIVNQMISTGGANIVNTGGQDYGLCTASFTPEENATFTYVESEDFTINSVYGADGTVTYEDVSTLDFSGNEFIGLWDVQSKVILQEINDGSMRLVMFMSASPDYYPLNTHALVITFEVVN